jgi:hypothetical protein
MDGSGGVPASHEGSAPQPTTATTDLSANTTNTTTNTSSLLSSIRLLSIDPLFIPNSSPVLLQNIYHYPVMHHDPVLNILLQPAFQSQLQNLNTAALALQHLPLDPSGGAPLNPAPAESDASGSAVPSPTETPSAAAAAPEPVPWATRCLTPPPKGTIRLLSPPPATECASLAALWDTDRTLREWTELAAVNEQAASVFAANQRERWLAWKVWYRLTQRIWSRRLQCNVDMIDMAAVSDADAVLVTDTAHRMIYRFHRRDLFNTLLSNICMSDEMWPNPREPRNPWTNAPFTYGQIVGVCQSLLQDYARRGKCPPVLFSAFWAAQFNLLRFASESASLLGQHAITTYFKDINDHNRDTVADTIIQLLTEAGIACTPTGVRRWLRVTPLTAGHREWLQLARDYTLYMNLHVQVRPHWHTEDVIQRDVRRLHQRHPVSDGAGPRVRALRDMRATPGPGFLTMPGMGAAGDPAIQSLITALLGVPDAGAGPGPDIEDALGNIQNSLFGARGSGGR